MKKLLLFCEGKTDKAFLCAYLKRQFTASFQERSRAKDSSTPSFSLPLAASETTTLLGQIIAVDGCNNIDKDVHINKMRENQQYGGRNLIVFDADQTGRGNNGPASARQRFQDLRDAKGIDFALFLWPNNQDEGDLETMLRLIAQKQELFSCLDGFERCLQSLAEQGLELQNPPSKKSKINSYSYHLSEQMRWNYQSEQLSSFRTFLEEQLRLF